VFFFRRESTWGERGGGDKQESRPGPSHSLKEGGKLVYIRKKGKREGFAVIPGERKGFSESL